MVWPTCPHAGTRRGGDAGTIQLWPIVRKKNTHLIFKQKLKSKFYNKYEILTTYLKNKLNLYEYSYHPLPLPQLQAEALAQGPPDYTLLLNN